MTLEEKTPLSRLQYRFKRVEEAIAIKEAIKKVLAGSETDLEKEKSIPVIAKEIGHPTNVVHWYLTSLRKYSIAIETPRREGQYHKWALVPKTIDGN
jgi:hypothetical protein